MRTKTPSTVQTWRPCGPGRGAAGRGLARLGRLGCLPGILLLGALAAGCDDAAEAVGDGQPGDGGGGVGGGAGGAGDGPRFEPAQAVASPTETEARLLRSAVAFEAVARFPFGDIAVPLGFGADGRAWVAGRTGGLPASPHLVVWSTDGLQEMAMLAERSETGGRTGQVPGTPFWAFDPVAEAAWAVYAQGPEGDRVAITRVTAADLGPTAAAPLVPVLASVPAPLPLAVWQLRLADAIGARPALVVTDAGRLCLNDLTSLWCWRPGETALTEVVSPEVLAALPTSDDLAVALAAQFPGATPVGAVHRILSTTALPDDRVGLLVRTQLRLANGEIPGGFADLWVLEHDPAAGAPVTAYLRTTELPGRPTPTTPGFGATDHLLQGASDVFWVPEFDALGVLLQNGDFTWDDPHHDLSGTEGLWGEPTAEPALHRGPTLLLFNRAGTGVGRLPLTEAWLRHAECPHAGLTYRSCRYADPIALRPTAAGTEAVVMQEPLDVVGNRRLDRLRLRLDAAAFDLDGDRLTAAEEAALGTDPWRPDTDGDGDQDGAEAHAAEHTGRDPLRADAPPRPDLFGFALSPTLGPRLGRPSVPLQVGYADFAVPGLSAAGPLCVADRCFTDLDRPEGARETAARWGDVPLAGGGIHKTVDGQWIALGVSDAADGNAVVLVHTETGARRTVLPQARLDAVMTRNAPGIDGGPLGRAQTGWEGNLRMVAASPDEIWVISTHRPARVAVFNAAGEARVVYEGEAWRCANGMGPCDPGSRPQGANVESDGGNVLPGGGPPMGPPPPVADLNPHSVWLHGYEPSTERLHLTVMGSWDTFHLALHAEKPAIRLPEVVFAGGSDAHDPSVVWRAVVAREPSLSVGPDLRLSGFHLTTGAGRALGSAAPLTLPGFTGGGPLGAGVLGLGLLFLDRVGLHELVPVVGPIATGELIALGMPIDTLTGSQSWRHFGAVRVPRRGGLWPWSVPARGLGEQASDPIDPLWLAQNTPGVETPLLGGISAHDGQTLCVALLDVDDRQGDFRRDGVLKVLTLRPGTWVERAEHTWTLPGLLDCGFEPDGTLLALTTEGVSVVPLDGGAPQPLGIGADAVALVRGPDGTHRARAADDAVAWLPDGTPVEATASGLRAGEHTADLGAEPRGVVVQPDGTVAALALTTDLPIILGDGPTTGFALYRWRPGQPPVRQNLELLRHEFGVGLAEVP